MATRFLFGKLFCVAALFDFGEKRCRKNLPLCDSAMTKNSAIAFVFALLVVSLPGCSRVYLFDGIVVDGGGNPIANATVMLFPHDWKRPVQFRADGESGDDGKFDANWGSAVGVDYFRIVIAADGYRETEQLVEADRKNLRIVLERDTDSAAASKPTESN